MRRAVLARPCLTPPRLAAAPPSAELPCRVAALNITGLQRTKRALIEAEMAKAMAATNHHDLAVELAVAHARLTDLDIFKSANAEVDVAEGSKPGEVMIDLKVRAEV